MSDTDTFWFHCGSCGRLFSSGVDFSEDRACPHCGENPSPVVEAAPPVQDAKMNLQPVIDQKQVQGNRTPRRMRALHKVLLVWIILMAAVFGVTQWLKSQKPGSAADDGAESSGRVIEKVVSKDRRFVDEALPQCREVLSRYLLSTSIEERLPLVLPHPDIRQRMENYYASNEVLSAKPEALTLMASTLVDLPEGETILTQWETPEGASFDAAFRQSGVEWRLDWNHFVRYSELSWALFLAGSGDHDVAEFRLLARRRLASDEDPTNGIGIVLSAPMRRHSKQVGFSQSMMGLSLNDEDGQLLESAFKREAAGFPVLGAEFRDINPEGMIRVRVRVERISEEGGDKYRIAQVLACHWYESEATGLE